MLLDWHYWVDCLTLSWQVRTLMFVTWEIQREKYVLMCQKYRHMWEIGYLEKQFKSMNIKFCSAWTRFWEPDKFSLYQFYSPIIQIKNCYNFILYLISTDKGFFYFYKMYQIFILNGTVSYLRLSMISQMDLNSS